ncbi:hypothetical protein R3P38DRAFT_2797490 [Favolaschia claudopus]|uniref:Uncharacterized protein n=1 Tax=Favolaschia claudopus TaxID=2862362 RepID=A0AAW0A2D9_9AGAR
MSNEIVSRTIRNAERFRHGQCKQHEGASDVNVVEDARTKDGGGGGGGREIEMDADGAAQARRRAAAPAPPTTSSPPANGDEDDLDEGVIIDGHHIRVATRLLKLAQHVLRPNSSTAPWTASTVLPPRRCTLTPTRPTPSFRTTLHTSRPASPLDVGNSFPPHPDSYESAIDRTPSCGGRRGRYPNGGVCEVELEVKDEVDVRDGGEVRMEVEVKADAPPPDDGDKDDCDDHEGGIIERHSITSTSTRPSTPRPSTRLHIFLPLVLRPPNYFPDDPAPSRHQEHDDTSTHRRPPTSHQIRDRTQTAGGLRRERRPPANRPHQNLGLGCIASSSRGKNAMHQHL